MSDYGSQQSRDWNALDDDAFRQTVREVFQQYPEELGFPSRRLLWVEQSAWWLRIAAMGWIAPNWPTEFGGMGLDPAKLLIFYDEQERAGIARYQDHGIRMIGPVLMRYGSMEQQRTFLPDILACRHRYAQGYSEPDSGSDLVSLRTAAHLDGEEWVITGSKIWTTMAHDATHMFLLAKTSQELSAPRAISFFLVPLDAAGITVRTIPDMAGEEELCEVFLDSVRVPAMNLIGPVNEGWTIAKSVLGFERLHVGSPQLPDSGMHLLKSLVSRLGGQADHSAHERVTALELDVEHLRASYGYFAALLKRGETMGDDVSMLKLVATETFQRIADTIIDLAGPAGAVRSGGMPDEPELAVLSAYYRARPSTIYGGTSEIQRNILAKRILGLPAG